MTKLLGLFLLVAVTANAKVALAPLDAQNASSFEFLSGSQITVQEFQFTNAKGTLLDVKMEGLEPENWFNLDPNLDLVQGVSTERTYEHFGEPDAKNEVIVAVIDSGVDVNHEALQGRVWMNRDEMGLDENGVDKMNNGIDDDGNGYVDDVFGWNFIGGAKGMATLSEEAGLKNGIRLIKGDSAHQVDADTLEITREVVRMRKLKAELAQIGMTLTKEEMEYMEKIEDEVADERTAAQDSVDMHKERKNIYIVSSKILKDAGLTEITIETVSEFQPETDEQVHAKNSLLGLLSKNWSLERIDNAIDYYSKRLDFYYNTKYDSRVIVGDDYSNSKERFYGNNDVIGPDSAHGTHVAGIIAAERDGNFGVKGVASNVKIMAIRCIPNGDERDKDVANSIRYAVDNGAKVINMSFGKSYSPYEAAVEEAITYAESKGVLLVHAAGNSNQDNDTDSNFPNSLIEDSEATNWLEIGASSFEKGMKLPASFSNYGDKTVDFFAPGVNIYSTTPDNEYASFSGTSMAAPVVAGVAALTLQYNPMLDVQRLRSILISTVTRYPGDKVFKPGLGMVFFTELSKYGGIANVFEAVSAAMRLKNDDMPFFMNSLAAN
jgi:subtilisin family serine protease